MKGAIWIGDSVVLQLPLFDGACVETTRGVGLATSGGETTRGVATWQLTVGHRPFPAHVAHAPGQFHFLPDKMGKQKRSACSSASSRSVGN